jgi:hypothetical protein
MAGLEFFLPVTAGRRKAENGIESLGEYLVIRAAREVAQRRIPAIF